MRILVILSLLPVVVGAALARPKSLDITLTFRPTEPIVQSGTVGRVPRAIALGGVTDARSIADRTVIGENREKSTTIPIHARGGIEPFTKSVIAECLKAWAVPVDDAAPIVMTVDVVRFFVTETTTYSGEMALRVTFANRDNKVVLQTTVAGEARRFGRSLSQDNYNEVISDALVSAMAALARQGEFWAVVAGAAPQPAGASAIPTAIRPEDLKAEILGLIKENVGEAVMRAFVKQRSITRPLSGHEVLEWKDAGIPESVIEVVLVSRM